MKNKRLEERRKKIPEYIDKAVKCYFDRLDVKRNICPECNGTKRDQNEWDELETCSTCKGKGQT